MSSENGKASVDRMLELGNEHGLKPGEMLLWALCLEGRIENWQEAQDLLNVKSRTAILNYAKKLRKHGLLADRYVTWIEGK